MEHMKINGKNIFPYGNDTPQEYIDSLINKNYVWIDNPFDDWMDDLEPYMKERRLGYYVR